MRTGRDRREERRDTVGMIGTLRTSAVQTRCSSVQILMPTYFEDEANADSEACNDLLYGTLLGADAQFALLEFVGSSTRRHRR